nr:DegT/DnrJ/EryC1/StrS family aminotransferase [Kibdelosporangium sp. MJ126-NF4]CEL17196.1 DegT/DnrJ/EryC1/StrS aminotransferase [Kibdelosporangium sp. MJ126-NF4]CTQ91574.1 DegT/DnrJ/EryC1/StrS aminotransferase [Kibdelosporangium sp. MJ126-NF4]
MNKSSDPIVMVRPVLPPLAELTDTLGQVLRSGVLTNDGARVRVFERMLSARLGIAELAVCGSGTTAIQLACGALGLTGEVIVPAAAFPAVSQAVRRAGCAPVAVEVEPTFLTLDPDAVAAAITPRTCAILAVHTFGCPADIDTLSAVAGKAGVPLLFDAATCWGIGYRDRPLLSYGDVSTLSLHAMKLTHSVEGGAVMSSVVPVADRVRRLRNFGAGKEGALAAGTNARMSELHAAVGAAVLAESDKEIAARIRVRDWYRAGLGHIDWLRMVPFRTGASPNVAAMAVRLAPDAPVNAPVLSAELVHHGVHSRAYFTGRYRPRGLGSAGPTPVADDLAERILCLPFWGGLTDPDVARVVDAIDRIGHRRAHRRERAIHRPA